ncbi:MAG TPA: hypothetical protein PLH57_00640 [Oligoflexia bacterium]|nr:hypothetical protein [Oligoflexia bacterium]
MIRFFTNFLFGVLLLSHSALGAVNIQVVDSRNGSGCGNVLRGLAPVDSEVIAELNRSKIPRLHVFDILYSLGGTPIELLAMFNGVPVIESDTVRGEASPNSIYRIRVAATPERLRKLLEEAGSGVRWVGFEWNSSVVTRALGHQAALARVEQQSVSPHLNSVITINVTIAGDAPIRARVAQRIAHLPVILVDKSASAIALPKREGLVISKRANALLSESGSDFVVLRAQVVSSKESPLSRDWLQGFGTATVTYIVESREHEKHPNTIDGTEWVLFSGSRRETQEFLKDPLVRYVELQGEIRASDGFWNKGKLQRKTTAVSVSLGSTERIASTAFYEQAASLGLKIHNRGQQSSYAGVEWTDIIITGPAASIQELVMGLDSSSSVREISAKQLAEIPRDPHY